MRWCCWSQRTTALVLNWAFRARVGIPCIALDMVTYMGARRIAALAVNMEGALRDSEGREPAAPEMSELEMKNANL